MTNNMKVKVRIQSNCRFPEEKGNTGIFVEKKDDVKRVKEILHDMDSCEYDGYFDDSMVVVFNPEGRNIIPYGAKFDFDVSEFESRCYKEEINVFVYSCNGHNYQDDLTVERAIEMRADLF